MLTGDDLRAGGEGPLEIVVTLGREEVGTTRQPVLPTDRVRFVGEPVAIVVADSRALAEDAAERVAVDWRPLTPVVSSAQALAADAPQLHDDLPGNNFAHIEYEQGPVDELLAGAAHVFRKRFDVGRWMAAPLETRGVLARYEPSTGEAEVWSSVQSAHNLRTFLAIITGIPEGRIRCIAPDVGGGFGMKGSIFPEDPAILVAAKIVGRPLKWIEDRVEHLAAASHAKQMVCDLQLATDADGRFLAFTGHYEGDAGAYAQFPPTPLIDVLQAAALLPSLYDIQAIRYSLDCAVTNKSPAAAARGVGWSSGQMARELLIDEAAHELGIDPAELRLRNCLTPERVTTVTGLAYDGGSYAEAIGHALELADYPELRAEQQRLRAEGRYVGFGISPFVEPVAYGTIHARALGLGGATYDSASVTVEGDGSVIVRTGFHSHGQGQQTTFAQVVGDALGVPLERVRILQGDTDATTFGFGTFGSRGAVIGTELLNRACADVRSKLATCAAHLLGAAADEIWFRDDELGVVGDPERTMTFGGLAGAVYFGGPETRPAGFEPVIAATSFYDPPESYTNGVALARVEVDVETGIVHVDHLWFVEDCGVMLNPMIVEGQVAGGAAQGIAMALLEELVYDEQGQLVSGTLMDYLYPSTTEVPPMTFGHLCTPAPDVPSGVKGAGEGGAIATPAAVLQAIADALGPFGARIDRSPMRPDRVLALIDRTEDA